MNNIKTIFLKELKKFFTDSRMLIALFLPGVIIAIAYLIMGNVTSNIAQGATSVKDTTFKVVYTNNYGSENEPKIITYLDTYISTQESEKTNRLETLKIEKTELENYKTKIENNDYHLLLDFSDNFENDIYDSSKILTTKINYFYQGENKASNYIYTLTSTLFDKSYSPIYYVPSATNVGQGSYVGNMVVSMIVPLIMVSLLFSTCVTICSETFAGEKERGTLSSMLLTPIKRSHLVTGKILALFVTATASGLVSFIGVAISMPSLFKGLQVPSFNAGMIFLFLLIIVSLLFFFVSLATFLSSLSKTVKEANAYLTPMTIIFVGLSIVPSLISSESIGFAFLPVLNIAAFTNQLFNSNPDYLFFSLSIISNLAYAGLFIYLTTTVFKKEKFLLN